MNTKVDIAVLALRVALGAIFLMHGMDKLFGVAGGSIEGFAGMLGDMGFQMPLVWAYLVAGVEAGAGFLLILGIIPRISATAIAIIMIAAIVLVHGPKGFFAKHGGYENNLLMLTASFYFMMAGAGRFSLWNNL